MKTTIALVFLLCATTSLVDAQQFSLEQFKSDEQLQDSVIAAIVPNHSMMSKLINKIAENRGLHEMVIQHLTRLLNEKPESTADHSAHQTSSPYAGEETREIKALSEKEVTSLLSGEGMGMAMAAELNHYPGPRHILDLGAQIRLDEVQTRSIKALFDLMHDQAVQLGKRIVEKERELDKAFASGMITLESLKRMTEEIGQLRGQLRGVHLVQHLATKKVLTKQQIESYDQLRGYTKAGH